MGLRRFPNPLVTFVIMPGAKHIVEALSGVTRKH
jgi:hypothetical protein